MLLSYLYNWIKHPLALQIKLHFTWKSGLQMLLQITDVLLVLTNFILYLFI